MESSKRQRLESYESSFDDIFLKLRNDDLTRISCGNENELIDVVDILQNQPNHSSLKDLCIKCKISTGCARLVAGVLKVNKSIISLRCTSTDQIICSDGAILIGDALKVNTTLECLDLRHNNISDAGAVAIANGIRENGSSSLTSLQLRRNSVGIVGARYIALMLTTNKSLTELNINRNAWIGTEGVIAIADALKQNGALTTLRLLGIPFRDDGARSIASMLTINVALKKLIMTSCGIGDAGAVAIADALKVNRSLTDLRLDRNPISNSVIANELARMLEINTTLKQFSLGDCIRPMDNAAVGSILKTLQVYNDTVNIHVSGTSDSIHDIVDKIRIISRENQRGCRIAPFGRRRIFNSLKLIWMTRTRDT
jgi:Ran GTPase-activating protein (RanGAP) involved in mRNA processing and transport